MRLDRMLANLGYGSRKEVKALFARGQVTRADGSLVDVDDKAAHAELRVEGQPLDPMAPLVILLHKPLGVTCSHQDAGPLVYDLLPERYRQREPALSSVGRLDKDTSGLLLLTDDGQLLHKLISPKHTIWKRYVATLARPLTGAEGEVFAAGTLMLESESKPCLPARLEVLQDGPQPQVAVSLTEGRYHQVRRMMAAVGNHVETLHRSHMGGLALPDDIQAGQWRVITPTELQQVFGAV
jgi:16S rRNA pseudouridine516 synthase